MLHSSAKVLNGSNGTLTDDRVAAKVVRGSIHINFSVLVML